MIGTGIVDIGSLGVTSSDMAAVVKAIETVAIAALFASLLGSTDPPRERFGAVGILEAAAHAGTGLDQLAVHGDGQAAMVRVAGEGGAGGDQAVVHQGLDQAVFTGQQAVR